METQNHIPPNTTANQEEEIYRIVAKIRSLEDDVRTVQNQNREIEAETKYLVRMLHDLEEAVDTQDQEIQQLTHHIQKESG